MATTITDEQLRQVMRTIQPYTVVLMRWGPKRHRYGDKAIRWEHTRRMVSLRADGLMPIVCPVVDETLVGVAIFNLPPEQASEVMEGDPMVQAGAFVYEVHQCRSFPGDALPA